MITNAEIANILRRVAAVFEIKDADFFRSRAYENAANSIENLTTSVRDLWEQNKLDEIPGVGPNLSNHIQELFKTGKVKHFDHELKRVPAGMFPLLDIRGVGPKTAYKIATKFKLNNEKTAIDKVKGLIASGKLAPLAINSSIGKQKRMLLPEVLMVSSEFLNYIQTIPHVTSAFPLGSIRRRTATVGDIDLGVCTSRTKEVMSAILKYPKIDKIISSGRSVSRVQLKTNHQVDVKLSSPSEWGSLLQHYTGSKLHNIALRNLALEKHLSLSEHGIKNLQTGKVYRAKSEKAFYVHLGLSYIDPELREGEEEISKAKKGELPLLVDLPDILGDLHLHSDFKYDSSHDLGQSSLGEILDTATSLGYQYIGVTDHNPKIHGSLITHRKKTIEARKNYLITQYNEYEKSMKTRVPKLLVGLEIDIRSSGELALEKELLNSVDYAIVSIHSSFELDKDENTRRIITALSHPKAVILGHPTGRLLNHREGIKADWLQIINFSRENGKILEINSSPQRLDLPDDLVKMAIRSGVRVCINTDSHLASQMHFMQFGVWVARRGWCQKSDVINSFPFGKLQSMLNLRD